MLRDDTRKSFHVRSGLVPLQLKRRVNKGQATALGEAGLGRVRKGLVKCPKEFGFHHKGSEQLIKAN